MNLDAPKVSHVRRERVRWLWPARIPFGKLSVLDGDPGLGKSTVALDLAARVSTTSPMPDGARLDFPVNTILLSAEDAIADTIRPRLEAHGGDLDRITVLRSVTDSAGPRPPELPADLPWLERLICEDEAQLVVIDPLMAFLNARVDAHRDQDVRRVLYGCSEVAGRTGAAIWAVRHLNKTAGGSALYRGGGSIGIIGAARSGMLIAPHPDDEALRILAMTKCNLTAKPASLAYRLQADDEYDCARIFWEGDSELTADALLNPPRESKRDEAVEFLEDLLADSPMPARDVYRQAEAEGISEKTLKRAKKTLGIESYRKGEEGEVGGGSWWWALDTTKEANDLEGQPLLTQVAPLISAGQGASGNGHQVKGANSEGPGSDTVRACDFDECAEPAARSTYWDKTFCLPHFKQVAAEHDANDSWPAKPRVSA